MRIALYGAETWTLRKSDKKYLGSSEMWCWRRVEEIRDERYILHTTERRKAIQIGHTMRMNCLPKQFSEGQAEGIDMTAGGRRRRMQLLDDLKEMTGYWKMKEEALDDTLWRTRFGRGYGPFVRHTTERIN